VAAEATATATPPTAQTALYLPILDNVLFHSANKQQQQQQRQQQRNKKLLISVASV